MPDRLHVHLPYRLLEENLPFLLSEGLQPEVAFQGTDLDTLDPGALNRMADTLREAGRLVTVHAPFMDLNPGALDPLVRDATTRRCRQTLEACRLLGADLAVFHPGYERWRYAGQVGLWLEPCLSFWPPLLEIAATQGCRMALENVFDEEPGPLEELLGRLDSPHLGHCFDVGHWRLFGSVSLEEWFDRLGDRILHLHLHDNTGQGDDHRPVGEGDIDFSALFRRVRSLPSPPSMTLEAHDKERLLRSRAGIAPFLLP